MVFKYTFGKSKSLPKIKHFTQQDDAAGPRIQQKQKWCSKPKNQEIVSF